uniref:Deacetylase sirtuin-type domain-containing protein n=1 Tax=Pyrodinium bahamense TaxID=73915 RepID=A0A7S0FCQ5_9DINO
MDAKGAEEAGQVYEGLAFTSEEKAATAGKATAQLDSHMASKTSTDDHMLQKLRALIEKKDGPVKEPSTESISTPSSPTVSKESQRRTETQGQPDQSDLQRRTSKTSVWSDEVLPSRGNWNQCMAGLVGAMCEVLHSLQQERDLSCLTLATAAAPQEPEDGAAEGAPLRASVEGLRERRAATDAAFGQALNAVKLVDRFRISGPAEKTCSDGAAVFQQVSVKAMLHRAVLDAACTQPPAEWMPRYVVCCCGETGYHQLIAKVIGWIVRVAKSIQQEERNFKADPAKRHQLMVVFKEHVGHQRSLMAAKGSSRWVEESTARETWDSIVKGRRSVQNLLRPEVFAAPGLQERLPHILEELSTMEEAVEQEAKDPSYSVPHRQIARLYDRLTVFINEVEQMINDELIGIAEAAPVSDIVLSVPVDTLLPETPHPGGPPSAEVHAIVEQLQEGQFQKVVVMVGAGISVSANIPDFRSPGGLYDSMRKQGFTVPEMVFTCDFMQEHPKVWYGVMQKIRTEGVDPTPTHCFIRMLQDKGMLSRCYTQNIDCLERKVGIEEDLLVEAHGTMGIIRCAKCRKTYDQAAMWEPKEADGIPRCEACQGMLRPDIVFFGEGLPNKFMENHATDLSEADLVIIMGTSLAVQPFSTIIRNVKNTCAVLVVNRNMPKTLAKHRRLRSLTSKFSGRQLREAAFLAGDCDDSIKWMTSELGWAGELEAMAEQRPWRYLPDQDGTVCV